MDIAELYTSDAHEEGAEVQLKHPATGEPLDVFIKVKGVDSRSFRQSLRKKQRAMLSALASKEDGAEVDEDQLDAEALAEATIGWRGIKQDGEEYEFSKERARTLYLKSPGIRSQLDAFISNRRNFTKG